MINIDWKKNNKIYIRNFSESFDLHNVVQLLLVKALRRKNRFDPIYTEFEYNGSYPDIFMKIKNDIYIFEIQEKITKKWKKEVIKKYEEVNLIIVPLSKFSTNSIKEIKEILKDYII